MRRAYKFWLRPNDYQKKRLEQSLETHRRIYNEALAMRKEAYEKEKKTLQGTALRKPFQDRRNEQKRAVAEGKEVPNWLVHISCISLRDTVARVDRAFDNFFRRLKNKEKPGYPRFRSRERYSSIPFDNYGDGCQLKDKQGKTIFANQADDTDLKGFYVRMFGVGDIRTKLHRPIKGRIKTITIKREADKWYAVFSCDLGDVQVEPSRKLPLGLDVGIKSFAVDSDGEIYQNPKYLEKNLADVKKLSKKIALRHGTKRKTRDYCQQGSKRRNLNKKKLRRLHTKVKNLRKESHYQTALKLVRQAGLVAVEDLNVKGMVRNHRLARAIADAGWDGFVNILKCKAESAGVRIMEVDPRGTTQQCSNCGRPQDEKIGLGDRWYTCQHCGLSFDRDHNAAINILKRGIILARAEPAGDLSSKTPTRRRGSKTVESSIPREAAQNVTGKQL